MYRKKVNSNVFCLVNSGAKFKFLLQKNNMFLRNLSQRQMLEMDFNVFRANRSTVNEANELTHVAEKQGGIDNPCTAIKLTTTVCWYLCLIYFVLAYTHYSRGGIVIL
jgi:hypothetical protein